MSWTLPNLLTVLRLLAAPMVALVFFVLPRPWADAAAMLLFISASVTDWFDGYLARKWNQISRFGTMLDPIADKTMVVIALMAVVGVTGMPFLVAVPATLILFREVFVSGLREFLGTTAGLLKVTRLAKWKTTVQMVAISVLFSIGIFEHQFGMRSFGMDAVTVGAILTGAEADEVGLRFYWNLTRAAWWVGVMLLWSAAALTFVTGLDYFRKALPYLSDDRL